MARRVASTLVVLLLFNLLLIIDGCEGDGHIAEDGYHDDEVYFVCLLYVSILTLI